MPAPLSLTVISAVPCARRSRTWTSPPVGVNFTAFDSRFHAICWSRAPSPYTTAERRVDLDGDRDALGVGGRLHDLQRRRAAPAPDRRRSVRGEACRNDPGHVEQLVDQPRLPLRVVVDRIGSARSRLASSSVFRAQHVGPAEDRVERRAQLVGDGREELILQAIAFLGARRAPRARARAAACVPLRAASIRRP